MIQVSTDSNEVMGPSDKQLNRWSFELSLSPDLSPDVTPAATMATETDFLQFTGRRSVAMAMAQFLAAVAFSCLFSISLLFREHLNHAPF